MLLYVEDICKFAIIHNDYSIYVEHQTIIKVVPVALLRLSNHIQRLAIAHQAGWAAAPLSQLALPLCIMLHASGARGRQLSTCTLLMSDARFACRRVLSSAALLLFACPAQTDFVASCSFFLAGHRHQMSLARSDIRTDLREAYKAGDIDMAEYLLELRKLREVHGQYMYCSPQVQHQQSSIRGGGGGGIKTSARSVYKVDKVTAVDAESDNDFVHQDNDQLEQGQQTFRGDASNEVHYEVMGREKGDEQHQVDDVEHEECEEGEEQGEEGELEPSECESEDDALEVELEAPTSAGLRLGPARHDFLGTGTILAIFDTKEHARDVAVDFEDEYKKGKVYFSFTKKEKIGRTWRQVMKSRWVQQDACESIPERGAQVGSNSDEEEEPAAQQRTAFEHMEQASHQEDAFTQGLPPVELARHERKRKLKRLKEASKRGHNKAGRKTIEPKVPVSRRIEEFPDNGLIEDCGELFCKPCCLTVRVAGPDVEYCCTLTYRCVLAGVRSCL